MRTFAIFFALASFATAQTPTFQTPTFEAADVHTSTRITNPYTFASGGLLRGDRYDLRKATMLNLIQAAYGVDPSKIAGGPSWLALDRFDVSAKAPADTSPENLKLMLQSLLADRFKLAVHNDTRPLPAFALSLGRAKHRLKEADPSSPTGCEYQSAGGSVSVSCQNLTLDAFAQSLADYARDYLGRNPVVNSTALPGAWDFDLHWNSRALAVPLGAERLTVFEAVEKQLGLQLDLRTAPSPVLVVDRANEKPTPNAPNIAQLLPPRPLEFEVAEIKLSRPEEMFNFRLLPSGRFEIQGFPMRIMMAAAWDIDFDHTDQLMANIPKWADAKRFDVVAKTTPGSEPAGNGFIDDDLRLMLRSLLIERFKIASHAEDRLIPAYTLTAVKPKLTKADPAHRSLCKEAGVVTNDPRDANPKLSRLLTCQNVTLAQFAQQIQPLVPDEFATPVVDDSGLKGAFDFTLSFSRLGDLRTGDPTHPSDPSGGISLFDALTKQLGLKLELRKRMIPVVVIDHMEDKPSEN